jgi:glucose-6-phosphate dehydrogenase assembly protein OpcA
MSLSGGMVVGGVARNEWSVDGEQRTRQHDVVLVNNDVQMMKGVGMAMDNSANPEIRIPWAGKQVRQEEVEDELASFWRRAADNMRTSQNMNVRTSVLNFVICAPDIESAYKASTLLRDLSSTLIARVNLLILDTRSDMPSNITTWVTLRSFPIISDIMRHHFEQITVMISGAAVQYAANVVQPLLKPDLPVYLWWLKSPPQDESILQRLIHISSRVVVDSRDFSHPEEQVRALSELLQDSPESALSDLNWEHITVWRELIAQFFDIGEYRTYLLNADSIEIEYATPSSAEREEAQTNSSGTAASTNPIGALLMAAWLKTRLGWQLSGSGEATNQSPESGSYSWEMDTRDLTHLSQPLLLNAQEGEKPNSIQISVQPKVQPDSRPGTLRMIRITGEADGKRATFIVERVEDDDHVSTAVEISGETKLQRTVNIAAAHQESTLMHRELEIMGRDHLYEETLHEVFALLT